MAGDPLARRLTHAMSRDGVRRAASFAVPSIQPSVDVFRVVKSFYVGYLCGIYHLMGSFSPSFSWTRLTPLAPFLERASDMCMCVWHAVALLAADSSHCCPYRMRTLKPCFWNIPTRLTQGAQDQGKDRSMGRRPGRSIREDLRVRVGQLYVPCYRGPGRARFD